MDGDGGNFRDKKKNMQRSNGSMLTCRRKPVRVEHKVCNGMIADETEPLGGPVQSSVMPATRDVSIQSTTQDPRGSRQPSGIFKSALSALVP